MVNYGAGRSAPTACAFCAEAIPPRRGPGRPRRYCGRRCGSAAERARMARRLVLGALVEQRTTREEELT